MTFKNNFFKPTMINKEYVILDMIENDCNITQRKMSQAISIAVSMVNNYLDYFEKDKLIKRVRRSTKVVQYYITKRGSERKKILNIEYLKNCLQLYNSAKVIIHTYLNRIEEQGHKNILLYGAGEVCEIFLQTMKLFNYDLKILGILDDDVNKIGLSMFGWRVLNPKDIFKFDFDGILITSYTHQENIKKKLIEYNVSEKLILTFFDNKFIGAYI